MTTVPAKNLDGESELRRIAALGAVGIIAGSGRDAGIDIWKKMLHQCREQLGELYRGDIDAPAVKIISYPELGLSMEMDCHAETIWPRLRSAATELAATCRAYTVACNTLHFFADLLHEIPGSEFISVQNVVRAELELRGVSRFALLGASPVMGLGRWSPYRALMSSYDIETADSQLMDRMIYQVKTRGHGSPELSSELAEVIASFESDVVVLGCTELPLIRLMPMRHEIMDVTSLLSKKLLSVVLPPMIIGGA